MIILSQNKKNIINFDRVSNIWIEEKTVKYQCPDIEDFWGKLGNYATEKRAKEVLQEIVNTYVRECKTYIMPEE